MLKKYPRKFLKSAQIAKSFGGKITIVEYDEKVAKQAKLDFERAGRHGDVSSVLLLPKVHAIGHQTV